MSGLTPESSAIKMTPDLEQAVSEAPSASAISAILRQAAIDQHLVAPDNDPYILNEVAPGTHPRAYAKVLVINGVKHTIEAETEEGLVKAELEEMKKIFNDSASANDQQAPRRDLATGQFVSKTAKEQQEAEIVRRAELDSAYRTGQITLADYVKQSGIVDEVIAERQQYAQQENAELETYGQTWQEASAEFLQKSDWPGTEENVRRLQNAIVELGLVDKPSVESLRAAYQHLIDTDNLAENPELTLQQKITEATSPEQLRAILGYHGESREDGRNYWGGR